MRLAAFALALCVVVAAVVIGPLFYGDVARWAVETQRAFQNEMAGAIRALRAGEPGALAALMAAAAAYGFVHAVGPGHGKYLIGGVGLGTGVSAPRLVGLAAISSLAQALWAIVLVYGAFLLLEASAHHLTTLAEQWLAPASYAAIALIGVLLALRGARGLWRHLEPRRTTHTTSCGCGHAHAPRAEEVAALQSWRDTVALVCSIAVRPCTGAVFLLVIAWQMDIQLAGAAAVITMGLGTALMTSMVAVSSIAARGLAFAYSGRTGLMPIAAPSLQLLAGLMIVWFSMALLRFALA
ncbi:MAG: hypothetical protein AAFN17_03210 [Pseudomonadota bacterium]